MNSKLWTINFSEDKKYHAIITLNDSDEYPRLDIGIIGIIQILDLKKAKEPKDASFLDNDLQENWIWVKNGKIAYWFFKKPDNASDGIERMFFSKPNETSVLVNSETMFEIYGCCRITTTHASDEEREEPLVKEPFTISARTLLTIF